MAYVTKYVSSWQNKNSGSCELKIQKQGYTGSVYDLTPTGEPFQIEWSQKGGNDLSVPLKVSTAQLFFYGDSNGEALSQESFDAADKEYRVQFIVEGSLYWQGYLAGDLRKDNPHTDKEAVKLEAIDGLALLENQGLTLTQDKTSLYDIIKSVLDSAQDLDIAANMEWYAYRSGNQIGPNTLPLKLYKVGKQAFDDLEPIEGEEGFETTGTRSAREILEGILDRFGMELFQNARGKWVMRQRHRIQSDGTIKMWDSLSDITNNNPTTKDLNNNLSVKLKDNKPRSGIRRLREVKSQYDYSNIGELVENSSFEQPLNRWKTSGEVQRKTYDNSSTNEAQTQEDQYLIVMDDGSVTDLNGDEGSEITQKVPSVFHNSGPRGNLEINFEIYDEINTVGVTEVKIRFGDNYYLQHRKANVAANTDPADDGALPLQNPIPGTGDKIIIPKGAELRTHTVDSNPNKSSITLSRPARAGDETLYGEIASEIKQGDYVLYFVWSDTTQTTLSGTVEHWGLKHDELHYPTILENESSFHSQNIRIPLHTPDGEVGNLAKKDLHFTVWSDNDKDSSATFRTFLDNVSVKNLIGDEEVSSTKYIAFDDQSGRGLEISNLIGSGPTKDHPKEIKVSGVGITTDWKNGTYSSGASPSGKGLEELTAKTLMRQQRDSLERRTHRVELRDGADVSPEDVFKVDGKLYTVSYLRRRFRGQKGDRAVVELSRLKDSGTAGLERAFYEMESGDSSSGGSGGSGFGGGGGGSSSLLVEGWEEIQNKPNDLFARTGDNDEYTSTIGLQKSDITEALGFTPADETTKLTGGDGINSIGDLSADRTISVNASHLAGDALSSSNNDLKVNASGLTGDGITSSNNDLDVDSTVARTNINETFDKNVTVQGDLTVNGTEFIANVQTVEIEDNLAVINKGETGSGVTEGFAGWKVDRGSLDAFNFGFDENRDRFVVGKQNRQVVATREDNPATNGLAVWNANKSRFDTYSNLTFSNNTLFSDTFKTNGATTGFTGSGVIIDNPESWFEDLQVRGSLIAREFELRKITVTKGDRVFGPGGGKIEEVSGNGPYTLTFSEPTGIQTTDICLVQESDLGSGDRTLIKSLELNVNSTSNQTKTVEVSVNSGSGAPEKGDDLVVVGSSDTSRDSLVFLSPYGPYIDALSGINSFNDWNNRQPNVRFGKIGGMPSIAGESPSGFGLWGDNVYLQGTIVANKGKIKDSVTIGSTTAGEVISATEAQNKVDSLEDAIYGQTTDEGTTIIDGGTIVTSLINTNEIAVGDLSDGSDYATLTEAQNKVNSLEDTIYGQTTDEGTTLIDGGTIVTDLINTDQIAVGDLSDGSDYAKLSEAQNKVDSLEDTIYGQSSDEGTTLINGGQIVTNLIAANEIAVGDLSDGGNYATLTQAQNKADDAESNAESYADGLDQSVRNDLQTTFENAVANGNTIIDGGVIATDLVTTDSVAFTPTDSSNIVGTINASTEGLNINADKLKINSNTTFASNYDPSTKAELSDIPDSSVTIRSNSKPSSRPDGSSLEDGDIWIDTDNGNRPHVYDKNNSNWDRQYTAIDGGNILTSTIQADSLSVIETNLGSVNIDENINMTSDGSILMGSGVDRFLLGDFDIDFVNNSKNGSIDMSGTNADVTVYANGSSQTNTGSADDFIGNIGGYLVDVNVGYEFSNSDNGGNRFNRDFTTSHSITLTVKFKNGTNVLKTVDKSVVATNAIADETGTATISGSAPSGTDTIELEAECSAQLGSDEGFYTSIGASVQDSNVNVTAEGSKDFVGGQGVRYTDQGNDILRLDATDMSHDSDPNSYKNEARIKTRGGMIVIEDENGTEQIKIHPQGYIDFRAQGGSNGNINGNDFPEPPSPWVRMGGESNNKKLARKSWDGGANDF